MKGWNLEAYNCMAMFAWHAVVQTFSLHNLIPKRVVDKRFGAQHNASAEPARHKANVVYLLPVFEDKNSLNSCNNRGQMVAILCQTSFWRLMRTICPDRAVGRRNHNRIKRIIAPFSIIVLTTTATITPIRGKKSRVHFTVDFDQFVLATFWEAFFGHLWVRCFSPPARQAPCQRRWQEGIL